MWHAWGEWVDLTFVFFMQHTQNMVKEFENMNISLDGIVLLDEAGKRNLQEFSNCGIDTLDYAAYLAQVGHNWGEFRSLDV